MSTTDELRTEPPWGSYSLGLMFRDLESERRFTAPMRVQALVTIVILVAAHILFQLSMAMQDDDPEEEEPEGGMPALELPIGLLLVIIVLAVDIKCKPQRRLWLTDLLVVSVQDFRPRPLSVVVRIR